MFEYKANLYEDKDLDFYDFCCKNIDGTNQLIYSIIQKYSPLSYLQIGIPSSEDISSYLPKSLPPTYLALNELQSGEKIIYSDFLKGYVLDKNGLLIMKDEAILTPQRGLLKAVLKKMAISIFHKNMVTFSMPARFFAPMSSIVCYGLTYRQLPNFINKAAMISDPIERMKLMSVYTISLIHTGLAIAFPFNSLLGETFQGGLEDGTSIYMEQISHHPAITYALVIGPKNAYRIYGTISYVLKFSGSSLTLIPTGKRVLEFKDHQTIDVLQFPSIKLGGLLMGDRSFVMKSCVKIEDRKNLLRIVIMLNGDGKIKNRPKDYIEGILYKYNPSLPIPEKIQSLSDLKDVAKEIAIIEGSWLDFMSIGGLQYWKIQDTKLLRMKYANNPIPSDARFREDLIYLKRGDKENADKWKDSLGIRQREDKKQRLKFNPNDKS